MRVARDEGCQPQDGGEDEDDGDGYDDDRARGRRARRDVRAWVVKVKGVVGIHGWWRGARGLNSLFMVRGLSSVIWL